MGNVAAARRAGYGVPSLSAAFCLSRGVLILHAPTFGGEKWFADISLEGARCEASRDADVIALRVNFVPLSPPKNEGGARTAPTHCAERAGLARGFSDASSHHFVPYAPAIPDANAPRALTSKNGRGLPFAPRQTDTLAEVLWGASRVGPGQAGSAGSRRPGPAPRARRGSRR